MSLLEEARAKQQARQSEGISESQPVGLLAEARAKQGIEDQAAQELVAGPHKTSDQESGLPLPGIVEPALAIASGAIAEPVAGLKGLAELAITGDPASATQEVEQTRKTISLAPETPEGQANLEKLGGLVQKGIDIFNYPVSGLAGLVELVTFQGLDKAVNTINSIQEYGLGKTLGERAYEETGSPALAAAGETIPTAAGAAIGLRGAKGLARVDKSAQEIASALFKRQSPTKRRIAKMMADGSTDVETAKYRLIPDRAPSADDVQVNLSGGERLRLSGPGASQSATSATEKVKRFLGDGGPRVARDKAAAETIRQGFDEGVIAAVKGSSSADKSKMLKMVDIMEKGKKNKRFAVLNRPSDVAGDSLLERFKLVRNVNKEAGKQLDKIASNLKGKRLDFSPQVGKFIDDLGDMGVYLDDSLKPVFAGSDLEGLPGVQRVVRNLIGRMTETKTPDAHDIHRLKRYIDEQVTYGKTQRGLSGKTEFVIKKFRSELDDLLDSNFDEYNQVNTTYAETIKSLDALQDVAGKKMDLSGGNADKAVGTLMRRLMSNAQSRVRLLDSIQDIESVAVKYGGKFDDDLITQALFVDELDAVFRPVARTSFQGQIDQAIQQSARAVRSTEEVTLSAAGRFVERVRGINEEAAFKSIKELLKQGD